MPTAATANAAARNPLWLLVRVNLRQNWRRLLAVRHQSRLLTAVISLFLVGYIAVSFWLFHKGLKFISSFPGLGTVLIERLLYLLFAFLFALLLLSNIVIGYGNLFRNREASFLLATPVPWNVVFQWKFIESTSLASWAFLFLVAPLLVAFGLNRAVPWHFYVVTPAAVLLFIVLPGTAGAWVAVLLARYMDRRTFQIAALACAAALLFFGASYWRAQPADDELLETRVLDVLDQLLGKTRFAQFPFLPSYWLSTAVIQWAEGAVRAAGFFLGVLLSYVLFFGLLTCTQLGNWFFDGVSAVQSRSGIWGRWRRHRRRDREPTRFTTGLFERGLNRLGFIDPGARALVLKDIRTFWRDTTQWGQTVMLFGLLTVYIMNLRTFTHQLTSPFWINMVSYLNLGACALNLATLTTRFVFPQFSLEGRRLWIVGMAPLGLARVVMAKYWLATISSLAVTVSLVTLSSWLLKMTLDRLLFFSAVTIVMTFALNGLSVGLGVLYPNFREANPSKIVSGFGGTLCLVLSFLYILASLLMLGFGTTGLRPDPVWVLLSVGGFVALSLAIGWVPLRFALARLPALEI